MINVLTGISSTSAALNAERIRLEVIAQNIANANTTRGPDGRPYQRQQVVFQTVLNQQQQAGGSLTAQGVQVARVEKDTRPPRIIHSPGHPDADANGNLAVPDINIHEEMADFLSASRSFEANLAVAKTSRSLAQQTLSIGKA